MVRAFEAGPVAQALKRRKCVVVPGRGVLAYGTVSPEQAFVSVSSVAFSCFVKFFADYLPLVRSGRADPEYRQAFQQAAAHLPPMRRDQPGLLAGPFTTRAEVEQAMEQAGLATVRYGLVDSYFGNVSYCLDDVLHISQTRLQPGRAGRLHRPLPAGRLHLRGG